MREPAFAIGQDTVKLIAEIDEFKGRWDALKILSPDRLNALRKVATVESIGSSTRIEGARRAPQGRCFHIFDICVRRTQGRTGQHRWAGLHLYPPTFIPAGAVGQVIRDQSFGTWRGGNLLCRFSGARLYISELKCSITVDPRRSSSVESLSTASMFPF